MAAGFVAWRQRPDNRMGLLMTLAGIVWFGRDLDWFDSAAAEHASELSLNLFLALVAHQIVVFPNGFARSRLERLLVLAAYGLAVLAYPPSESVAAATTMAGGPQTSSRRSARRSAVSASSQRWTTT